MMWALWFRGKLAQAKKYWLWMNKNARNNDWPTQKHNKEWNMVIEVAAAAFVAASGVVVAETRVHCKRMLAF